MASIPQPSHPWAINLATGDSHRVIPATSRTRITISHVFLVDTGTAGVSLGAVHACVEVGPLWHTVTSLSADSPFVVLPDPIVLDQEFTLYVLGGDPSDEFIVEVGGYEYRREECHDDEVDQGAENEVGAWSPDFDDAAQSSEDDDDSNDEDDENSSEEEDEDGNEETEIDSEDYNNSDAEDFEYSTEEEEEEESHGDEVDEQAAIASSSGDDVTRNSVPCGKIVGAPVPHFASVGSTVGFMRVTTVESQEEGDNGDKEISILYRCTHFSAASGEGVRVPESTATTMYQLRFVIPPAGDTARYLLFAGVSLPLQVYPARYSKRLHTLWSSLIAEVSVPTQPARVEVLVDFGIIRTVDRTPKRMERMRAALEGMVGKDFHPEFHLEFQLPESAKCGTNEDCTVCFELLEGEDLVTWPGCSKPHVFHGSCLELVLERSNKCPICRNIWSVEPKRVNIRKKDESRDN